jgi:hypothetical protein
MRCGEEEENQVSGKGEAKGISRGSRPRPWFYSAGNGSVGLQAVEENATGCYDVCLLLNWKGRRQKAGKRRQGRSTARHRTEETRENNDARLPGLAPDIRAREAASWGFKSHRPSVCCSRGLSDGLLCRPGSLDRCVRVCACMRSCRAGKGGDAQ